MKELHIVTPTTRSKEYLDRCYESIQQIKYNWKWFIVTNKNTYEHKIDITNYKHTTHIIQKRENKWNSLINEYLDNYEGGQFVYFLDDDNLIHENFNTALEFIFDKNFESLLFSQYGKIGDRPITRIIDENHLVVERVDQGQIIYKRNLIGNLRYWEDVYRGDGYFIMEYILRLQKEGKASKIIINREIFSYYNAQQWKYEK